MDATVTVRILSNGKLREANMDEAMDCADEEVVWVDVLGRDVDVLLDLQGRFNLHHLAIEDAANAHQRPKLDDYASHLFLVFYGLGSTPNEDDDEEFDVFIRPGLLITVRDGTTTNLESVIWRLSDPGPPLARSGYLAWALMDEVVDRYFPVIDALDAEVDDLEECLFEGERPDDIEQRIYVTRKQLIRLRRRIAPMREVLNALLSRPELSRAVNPYLQDVYDHVLRATDTIDTLRDLVASAHDSYLTQVSNDMNRVMKRFTSVGAILVVGALVTGIYGMNFQHMPELDWRFGYPVALGGMVAVMAALLWYFKRRDWL